MLFLMRIFLSATVLFCHTAIAWEVEQNPIASCLVGARNRSTLSGFMIACQTCYQGKLEVDSGASATCSQLGKVWCLGGPSPCKTDETGCRLYDECSQDKEDKIPEGSRDVAKEVNPPQKETKSKPVSSSQPKSAPTSPAATNTASTGNAEQDKQNCSALAQDAIRSCMQTTSASYQQGPAAGQSMAEYCAQMRSTGQNSYSANSNASGICYQKMTSCVNQCQSMQNNYSGDTAQFFQGQKESCQALSSRVQLLANQGFDSKVASSAGTNCDSLSQAMPQSGGSSPQSNSSNGNFSSSNSASDPCSSNPESSACQAQKLGKSQSGEAGFENNQATKEDGSGFNLNSEPSLNTSFSGNSKGAESSPIKVGTVANNSGGGIPQGNEAGSARMNNGKAAARTSPGYSTDVLQGLSSPSGYSAASAGPGESDDGGGGSYGGGYNGGRDPSSLPDTSGLDLKRYLPGGDKNPFRHGLGGFTGLDLYSRQILGKHVNIWERISVRMQEKCQLGQLLDCR